MFFEHQMSIIDLIDIEKSKGGDIYEISEDERTARA